MPLKVRTFPSALTTPSRTPSAVFCWTLRICAKATGERLMRLARIHPACLRNCMLPPDLLRITHCGGYHKRKRGCGLTSEVGTVHRECRNPRLRNFERNQG